MQQIYEIQFKDNQTSKGVRLNSRKHQTIFTSRDHFKRVAIQYQTNATKIQIKRLLKNLIQSTKDATDESFSIYPVVMRKQVPVDVLSLSVYILLLRRQHKDFMVVIITIIITG